jgi:hypothetical protein
MFGVIFFVYLTVKAQDQKELERGKTKLQNKLLSKLNNLKQMKGKVALFPNPPPETNKDGTSLEQPTDANELVKGCRNSKVSDPYYYWCDFMKQSCPDPQKFYNNNNKFVLDNYVHLSVAELQSNCDQVCKIDECYCKGTCPAADAGFISSYMYGLIFIGILVFIQFGI